MQFSIYGRILMPSYIFRSSVLAWECSVCRKLFSISADEAEREQVIGPPAHIEQDFRLHSCELVLAGTKHKHDPASVNPLSVELRKTSRGRRQS